VHRLLSIAVVASLLDATAVLADGRSCLESPHRADSSGEAAPFVFKAGASLPEITLREAPSFLLAEGVEGPANAACLPGALGEDLLAEAVQQVLAEAGLDPRIAIVLTSARLTCGALFYLPIANDVRGIGYQHDVGREVFDDSPDSALEGIAFLNDWPYWRERPEEFATAFLHEVGHRWGARVHARIEGEDSDELLGRQLKHWAYFVDTAGSPLEGNRFRALGGDRYEASTPLGTGAFSPLDLYLMGVLPAADVAPFGLLRAGALALRDCKDLALNAASPPQFCEPLELIGERIEVSLDDILAVEGPRDPAPTETPRELDVAVVVLSSNAEAPLQARDCNELSTALDEHLDAFARATGARIALKNLTGANDASCTEWHASPVTAPPPTCSLQAAPRHTGTTIIPIIAALAVLASTHRARTSRRTPRLGD
jgi:hypothetical protein